MNANPLPLNDVDFGNGVNQWHDAQDAFIASIVNCADNQPYLAVARHIIATLERDMHVLSVNDENHPFNQYADGHGFDNNISRLRTRVRLTLPVDLVHYEIEFGHVRGIYREDLEDLLEDYFIYVDRVLGNDLGEAEGADDAQAALNNAGIVYDDEANGNYANIFEFDLNDILNLYNNIDQNQNQNN